MFALGLGVSVETITRTANIGDTVNTGAVLGWMAYKQSGYRPLIDDLAVVKSLHHIQAVPPPDSLTDAVFTDQELDTVLKTAVAVIDERDEGGTLDALRIGAGCTRIFYAYGIQY